LHRLLLVLFCLGLFPAVSLGEVNAELGVEVRAFRDAGLFGQERFQPSFRAEVEYLSRWGDNDFEVRGFGRYDLEDDERSRVDLREAAWTHVGNGWELKMGVSKEFWGVTESLHLVDVINQTDLVENLNGEDRLGQPMTKVSFEQDWGTLDLFWLPYFRERTFVGKDGRLGYPVVVDTDAAEYDSGAKQWRSDFAFRYSHYIGEFEFAISHFSGTSREPSFRFNGDILNPILTPFYLTIDQTGLELMYIYEDWLFNFEGISNSGIDNSVIGSSKQGERYSAAVFGLEYTQVGIFDSRADLGWLLEYLFDDRKEAAPTNFEQDIFVGWRYAFNDEDSSEILAGFAYDPESEEILYSVEASKRLTNDLKINIEALFFEGGEPQKSDLMSVLSVPSVNNKTAFLQNEDYIQLELVKYF